MINKNMLKVVMEGGSGLAEKLNQENYALIRQKNQLQREVDSLNTEILLKNQVIEENTMNAHIQMQNMESDMEQIKHNYDRKELILQNLERKLNYYEMYITKQASHYGRSDREADYILKKFQHEKFSGGIESTELYRMQQQEESKLSNVVQENIELKKQNKDLNSLVTDLLHVRDIHKGIVDKGQSMIKANGLLRTQLVAKDNMIRELIEKVNHQK
eukprot:CAMPEP_0170485444 /NCGR_PEP_ID=MMETSP0208-20121228/4715_1 /TAXON_ID=197538 /ORGANISM="Strombidium inclinatum, Strain S3" /LENGTH=215 /DNA_ID=CAMNT_0010759101 /DNA_START=639 /DNA_END=1286 /DNA_ORIENTATION=+